MSVYLKAYANLVEHSWRFSCLEIKDLLGIDERDHANIPEIKDYCDLFGLPKASERSSTYSTFSSHPDFDETCDEGELRLLALLFMHEYVTNPHPETNEKESV